MSITAIYNRFHGNRVWKIVIVISLALLISFMGLQLFGLFWSNVLMIDYSKRLATDTDALSGKYPHINVFNGDTEKSNSERILELYPTSEAMGSHIYWVTGRVKLARGEYQEAANDFKYLQFIDSSNFLLQQDTLSAFSLSDRADQTITYYESKATNKYSPSTNDAVAYSYLVTSLNPDQETRVNALLKASQVRPDDLYANFHLWKYQETTSHLSDFRSFQEAFTSPTFTAIYPTDRRLLEFITQSFFDLYKNRIWERDELVTKVSFLIQQQANLQLVQDLLKRLITAYPSDDIWHYLLGVSYKASGSTAEAIQSFQNVLNINPEFASTYLQLGMIYESECKGDETSCILSAMDYYEQFLTLSPENLLGLKKLSDVNESLNKRTCIEPNCAINEKAKDNWLRQVLMTGPEKELKIKFDDWYFLGYRVDESIVGGGEPSPLWLYWSGPPGKSPGGEEDGWYHLNENNWVQLIEGSKNLIFDGGFELGTVTRFPAGFPTDMYLASKDARYLAREERSNETTTVAVLNNDKGNNRSSYISPEIALESDSLYLQTGWMRSIGGIGYYGRNWKGKELQVPHTYSYLAAGVTADNWTHYSDVLEPLLGASHLQVWLLNAGSQGQVQFDDVILVKIDDPR